MESRRTGGGRSRLATASRAERGGGARRVVFVAAGRAVPSLTQSRNIRGVSAVCGCSPVFCKFTDNQVWAANLRMQMQILIVSISCLVVQCAPVGKRVFFEDDRQQASRSSLSRWNPSPDIDCLRPETDAAPPAGQHCGLGAAGLGLRCTRPSQLPGSFPVLNSGPQRSLSCHRLQGPLGGIPLGSSAPPPVTLNRPTKWLSVAEQPHQLKTPIALTGSGSPKV